jgi:hypothetical protein
MPTYNEVHPYNFPASQANDFDRKGHPGKWLKSIAVSGTVWFTGSNYGAGAIIPYSSAAGTAYLTGGGSINIGNLAKTYIHELSIERIESGADCYVLIRNQMIR